MKSHILIFIASLNSLTTTKNTLLNLVINVGIELLLLLVLVIILVPLINKYSLVIIYQKSRWSIIKCF